MAKCKSAREYNARKRKEIVGMGWRGLVSVVSHKPNPDDVRQRRAEVPEDTRTLTALLLGDPLPGRRAIDRRQPA